MSTSVPVIDLFAGPGGLSEGFHRYAEWSGDDDLDYRIKLSIEKDPIARKTLRLRAFFRQFTANEVPEAYYNYVKAETGPERARWLAELQTFSEWQIAESEARLAELGDELDLSTLISWVRDAVGPAPHWVLLGGPPCQAYSVMGRVRRTGIGAGVNQDDMTAEQISIAKAEKAKEFFELKMHGLYRQYLGILAFMQPAVFIMENVKGILSSKDPDSQGKERGLIFPKILQDLADPWSSFKLDQESKSYLEAERPSTKHGYKVHGLVSSNDAGGQYTIRCEDQGIPQKRHRVILIGVRDDLNIEPNTLAALGSGHVTVSDVLSDLPKLNSDLSSRWARTANGRAWHELVAELLDEKVSAQIEPEILDIMRTSLATAAVKQRSRGAAFKGGEFRVRKQELGRWYWDERLKGAIQHQTRSHMPGDLARYLFISAYASIHKKSPHISYFPRALLPDHKNVQKSLEAGEKPDFADRFRVQVGSLPASTVTAHIGKDGHYYVHPDPAQCRSLSVREAARIQTFPDNYFFEGAPSQQYHQIGNAVPPYLAVQVAEIVADVIKEASLLRRAAA